MRFVYTIELSLEWVNSPLFASDRQDYKFHSEVRKYLDAEQNDELDGYLEEIVSALREVAEKPESGISKKKSRVIQFSKSDAARAALLITQTVTVGTTRPKSQAYMLSAAIVSIYSSFETFAGTLLETLYFRRPKAISGNPSISLNEIVNLSDRRSIIKRIASRQAESELQEPITAWLEKLTRHSGISLPRKRWDWHDPWRHICALSAIRNCVVHSGGRVDRKLVDRMSEIGQKSAVKSEGDLIELSEEDIRRGIESCLDAATRLCIGLSVNQTTSEPWSIDSHVESTTESKVLHWIATLQWDLIDRKQYGIARMIGSCRPPLSDEFVRDVDVATWSSLALEGIDYSLDGLEALQWNHRASHLHKYALLNRCDELNGAIVQAIAEGHISKIDLLFAPEYILIRKCLGGRLEDLRQGWEINAQQEGAGAV